MSEMPTKLVEFDEVRNRSILGLSDTNIILACTVCLQRYSFRRDFLSVRILLEKLAILRCTLLAVSIERAARCHRVYIQYRPSRN